MSVPQIPPRPQRNQAGPTEIKNELPGIPPRPVRKTDPSPNREAYTRSPLNSPPVFTADRRISQELSRSSPELPRRPPSVSLPSVGQEGSEYSSYDNLPSDAPGGSLNTSSSDDADAAQQKSAAAAGIGTVPSADDAQPSSTETGPGLSRVTSRTNDVYPLRAKASFNRSTSSLHERSTSRPTSIHGGVDYEQGIPEIGKQVPLLAYAGDVQAPSPAPGQSTHAPGIGFWNDGSARNHNRKRSSRQEFYPPDVYGMRHDHDGQDKFERAWAAKHPEEAAKEEHHLHLPRPESAMSSEQLNRLVHQHSDIGVGTSRNAIGTPDEQTAFAASQEYVSRMSTPVTQGERRKRPSSGSQTAVETPFRKTFSLNENRQQHEQALDSEDEPSYHLKPPSRNTNKVTGGGDVDDKMNLGPHGEDGGYISEHADSAPILASDEIVKRPGSAYMQAAVEPSVDRNLDDYYDSDHGQWPTSRRNSANPTSRPSSRPSSIHGNVGNYHGGPLHRFVSHEEHVHSSGGTPLAEIEEYEPLFPEDEKEVSSPKRAFKKRPDLSSHHFPSQDVWEDNPSSLEYSATVSTPDLERELPATEAPPAASFETPAQEQARRDQNPDGMTSSNKTFAKPHFKPGVQDEVHRPGVQRFPSSDVWEDSPDSVNLTTTVSSPQFDDSKSPADDATTEAPSIPTRPGRKSKLAQEVNEADSQSANLAAKSKPTIPARPVRATQAESSPLDSSAPKPKAKPTVPARPTGSKIAALQGGFLNDLNNRLKLGPHGPPPPKKEPEPEPSAEPLADARKSRAKGPARRKPGNAAAVEMKKSSFAFSPLITVWTIDEEDEVQVQPDVSPSPAKNEAVKPRAPSHAEAESVLVENETKNMEEKGFSAPPLAEEESLPEAKVGAEGDEPELRVSSVAVEEEQAVRPELENALQEARPLETAAAEASPQA